MFYLSVFARAFYRCIMCTTCIVYDVAAMIHIPNGGAE